MMPRDDAAMMPLSPTRVSGLAESGTDERDYRAAAELERLYRAAATISSRE